MSQRLLSKSQKALPQMFTEDLKLTSNRSKSLKRKLEENKKLKDEDPSGDENVLKTEEIINCEWRARRNEASHLFPETEAERLRRKAKTNKKIRIGFVEEEQESYPFEFQLRPIIKTVRNSIENMKHMKNELISSIVGKKYVSKAERKRRKLALEYERQEKEKNMREYQQNIQDSRKQQSMIRMALLYLSKAKLGGHHRVAQGMVDNKNNPESDLLLRRIRKKHLLLGDTSVDRHKRHPEMIKRTWEQKKTWNEVFEKEIEDRDGYIPLRHANYFGVSKIYALKSHPATFSAFENYRGTKQVVCPEIQIHKMEDELEVHELEGTKEGLRLLQKKKEEAELAHIDKMQKKTLYTRLKSDILDLSRKYIRTHKQDIPMKKKEIKLQEDIQLDGHERAIRRNRRNIAQNVVLQEMKIGSDMENSLLNTDEVLESNNEVRKKAKQIKSKSKSHGLIDSNSLSEFVIEAMKKPSFLTPSSLRTYYPDYKPESAIRPSLSSPVFTDVQKLPEKFPYSSFYPTTYEDHHCPQEPIPPQNMDYHTCMQLMPHEGVDAIGEDCNNPAQRDNNTAMVVSNRHPKTPIGLPVIKEDSIIDCVNGTDLVGTPDRISNQQAFTSPIAAKREEFDNTTSPGPSPIYSAHSPNSPGNFVDVTPVKGVPQCNASDTNMCKRIVNIQPNGSEHVEVGARTQKGKVRNPTPMQHEKHDHFLQKSIPMALIRNIVPSDVRTNSIEMEPNQDPDDVPPLLKSTTDVALVQKTRYRNNQILKQQAKIASHSSIDDSYVSSTNSNNNSSIDQMLSTRSSSSYVGNNHELSKSLGNIGISIRYQNQNNIAHLQPSVDFMKKEECKAKQNAKMKKQTRKHKHNVVLKYFNKTQSHCDNGTDVGMHVNHYKYNSNEPLKGHAVDLPLPATSSGVGAVRNERANNKVLLTRHQSNLTETVQRLYAQSKAMNRKPHTIVPMDNSNLLENSTVSSPNHESSVDAVRSCYLADNSVEQGELLAIPMTRNRSVSRKDNVHVSKRNKSSTFLKPRISSTADGDIQVDIQNHTYSKYKFHFISKKHSDLLKKRMLLA